MPGDQLYFSLPPRYRARYRALVDSNHRGHRSLSGLTATIVTEYLDRLGWPAPEPSSPAAEPFVPDEPLPPLPPKWSAPLNPPRGEQRRHRQVVPSTPDPPAVAFTPPVTPTEGT
jgi:hypothetical protein